MHITTRLDGSSRITTRRKIEITGTHAAAPIHKRRRKWFVATGLVGVAFAGSAAAYFVSEGSGTGSANVTVGTPAPVAVTVTGLIALEVGGGALVGMQPGTTPAQTATWELTDASATQVSTMTAAASSSGGNVINQTTGLAAPGCLSSWFVVGTPAAATTAEYTPAATLPFQVTPTAPIWVTASVYLQESGTNQSACEGISPEIDLTIS